MATPTVDAVDDGVVHLPNRLPRAVGELQDVLVPEVRVTGEPDHSIVSLSLKTVLLCAVEETYFERHEAFEPHVLCSNLPDCSS